MEGFVVAQRQGFEGYNVRHVSRPSVTRQDLAVLGAWFSRQNLAAALGEQQFGTDRDVWKVCGYSKSISFEEYDSRYRRGDLASTIVNQPAEDTWRRPPSITEDGEEETAFCEAWDYLVRKLRVFSKLTRADQMSGIGRYGVLLIGVKDGQDSLAQEVKPGALKSPKDVLYLRPFHEGDAEIAEWVEEAQDPRYGLPLVYKLKVESERDAVNVHHSRVLHLAENKGSNEAYGEPRLRRVWNRLDDIVKLVAGTSEATWLNMRPGLAIGPKEGYALEDTSSAEDDFLKEMKRYQHDPLRILRLMGMDVEQIGTGQVLDPSGAYKVVLGLISAATRIPQRVLEGSAAGELAAAREDLRQWYAHISDRQKNYAEPEILRPFIDRLIWMGALPEPVGGPDAYHVGQQNPDGAWTWPALYELDDLELAEVRESRARAAQALADPLAAYPLDDDEKRELLGLEPREQEAPVQEPEALARARQNYRDGTIDAVALAELVALQ